MHTLWAIQQLSNQLHNLTSDSHFGYSRSFDICHYSTHRSGEISRKYVFINELYTGGTVSSAFVFKYHREVIWMVSLCPLWRSHDMETISTLLALCEGIHWWPLYSPHKLSVICKACPCYVIVAYGSNQWYVDSYLGLNEFTFITRLRDIFRHRQIHPRVLSLPALLSLQPHKMTLIIIHLEISQRMPVWTFPYFCHHMTSSCVVSPDMIPIFGTQVLNLSLVTQ